MYLSSDGRVKKVPFSMVRKEKPMKNGTNPTNSQPVAKGCDDRKPKEEMITDHESKVSQHKS